MAAVRAWPCKRCGCPMAADSHAWYCNDCHKESVRDWCFKSHRCATPTRDTSRSNCKACLAIKQANIKVAAAKAVATRAARHPHRQPPQHASQFWQQKALSMVASAKRHGILPKLDGSIACADCGIAATVYEHRDYSRPLDVEPVCGTCNSLRGTAKWPSPDQFNFPRVAAA